MENEFSNLPENIYFSKNQSVIPKSARHPQVVSYDHPENQAIFAN